MRILVIGLSRELPLGPADAMELADHLVKRAAAVQADGEGPSGFGLGPLGDSLPLRAPLVPAPCRGPVGAKPAWSRVGGGTVPALAWWSLEPTLGLGTLSDAGLQQVLRPPHLGGAAAAIWAGAPPLLVPLGSPSGVGLGPTPTPTPGVG